MMPAGTAAEAPGSSPNNPCRSSFAAKPTSPARCASKAALRQPETVAGFYRDIAVRCISHARFLSHPGHSRQGHVRNRGYAGGIPRETLPAGDGHRSQRHRDAQFKNGRRGPPGLGCAAGPMDRSAAGAHQHREWKTPPPPRPDAGWSATSSPARASRPISRA